MRFFLYSVAVAATLLSAFLWWFVLSDFSAGGGRQPAASLDRSAAAVLPVAPVLRGLVPVASGALSGCWRGYRAHRFIDADGTEHIVWDQASTGRIPC